MGVRVNDAKSSRLRGRLGKVVLNIHLTKVLTADISTILWLLIFYLVKSTYGKHYFISQQYEGQ